MIIELILWIVAFLVVWEFIFIKSIQKDEEDGWIQEKIRSGMATLALFIAQFAILLNWTEGETSAFPLHYERLLYEAIIIIVLFLFFKGNKWLYSQIKNKPMEVTQCQKKKQKKKRKRKSL